MLRDACGIDSFPTGHKYGTGPLSVTKSVNVRSSNSNATTLRHFKIFDSWG